MKPVLVVLEKDVKNWVARERFWIRKYRRAGARLTNATDGGEGVSGHKQTKAERMKHSLSIRKFCRENPTARSNSNKGRRFSEETKKKIAKAHLGKALTIAHRRAISAAFMLMGDKNPAKSLDARRKISEAKKGFKMSEETKEKMRHSARRSIIKHSRDKFGRFANFYRLLFGLTGKPVLRRS